MAEEWAKCLLPSSPHPLTVYGQHPLASPDSHNQLGTWCAYLLPLFVIACYSHLCHILSSAVAIESEGEFGSDDGSDPTPCMASNGNIPDTIYLVPTDLPLPNEPCSSTQSSDSTTGEILTVVLPIALFSILVCAVMVGIGILSCYIVVSKKLQGSK